MRMMLLAILVLVSMAICQSLERELIGAAGGGLDGDGMMVQWSLGETAIGPADTQSTITIGFHQAECDVATALSPEAGDFRVRTARSGRHLRILLPLAFKGGVMDLLEGKGRTTATFSLVRDQTEVMILMERIRSGVGFIRISERGGRFSRTYKIIRGEAE